MCVIEDTTVDKIIASETISATLHNGSVHCTYGHRTSLIVCNRSPISAKHVTLSNIRVVKNRSLASRHRDLLYPDYFHAYLYGTPGDAYIDHVLVRAQNVQITTTKKVDLKLDSTLTADQLREGVVVKFLDIPKRACQPLSQTVIGRVIHEGSPLRVEVFKDPSPATAQSAGLTAVCECKPTTQGTLTMTAWPWTWEGLNAGRDPWAKGKLVEVPRSIGDLLKKEPPIAPRSPGTFEPPERRADPRSEQWAKVMEGLPGFRK